MLADTVTAMTNEALDRLARARRAHRQHVATTRQLSAEQLISVRGRGPRDNLIFVDEFPFDKAVHFDATLGEDEDALPEDESPEVSLLLAQRMEEAAEHLAKAYRRANGRG